MSSTDLIQFKKLYDELTDEINRWRKLNEHNIEREQILQNERTKLEVERSIFEAQFNNTMAIIQSEYKRLYELNITLMSIRKEKEEERMRYELKKRLSDESHKIIEEISTEHLWRRDM